jgi:glycosyltransferase EpsD
MKKKILFCATVDYHFKAFHLPYMKWFKEQGWEVHLAASGHLELPYVDQKFSIEIQRSPIDLKNFRAYKSIKDLTTLHRYDIIHCHTPMGGVLTRLASRLARKSGTKVLYTAHGFHFCKGSPFINWLIYYPIEKLLSRQTDCLITINREDYLLAKRHHFKADFIDHVHGVGVNTDIYKQVDDHSKMKLREEYGYSSEDFIMFYAAEFNANKNQKLIIEALAKIKSQAPNAKVLFAGKGHLLKDCQELANQLGVGKMIEFLGFREDILSLLNISNMAIASSRREGLPVNIMEAMACGLPILATVNRGHNELIRNGKNGYLVAPDNVSLFSEKMLEMYQSKRDCQVMGKVSFELVKRYSLSKVRLEMIKIYRRYMAEDLNETKSKHRRAYI